MQAQEINESPGIGLELRKGVYKRKRNRSVHKEAQARCQIKNINPSIESNC